MSHSSPELPSGEQYPLWYQPVFKAMKAVDAVLRGATLLRRIAYTVAVIAVVGGVLQYFDGRSTAVDGGISLSVSTNWYDFRSFLVSLRFPLALAAMVFAFSLVLKNSASRLNLNIVLAHEQSGLASPETDPTA